MSGNREYKSDVFSMLMEYPENALEVYNAMNGTDYKDPSLVEMHTLDKGVSLSVRNDAAFVVDASLSVYEHQSTVCPNMPVRNLIYYSSIIQKMIKNRNIYGHSRVKIVAPKFIVFYNGDEEQPEHYEMKLSDSFEKQIENPGIELVCHVYNINKGRNAELMKNCKVLREYMIFVDYVREYYKEQEYEYLETAINKAINRCVSEDVLKDFLMSNRSEVVKVTQLDYTFDRQIALERIESREEGREEEREELITKMLKSGKSVQAIVEFCGLEESIVQSISDKLGV